jgi:hypothetical protein
MRETDMTEIYAAAGWYRTRPEPEGMWQGRLQKRTAPVGPAGRGGLSYTLVTEDEQLPVYAANIEGKLAPFVGYEVVVRGKLVDLSDEGFGQELWIASIRTVGTEQR